MKHLEIALMLAGIAIVFSNVSLIMRDAKHYRSAAEFLNNVKQCKILVRLLTKQTKFRKLPCETTQNNLLHGTRTRITHKCFKNV